MSFLNQITAQRIAAEDEKLPERIAAVNSIRLTKIIEFILTVIAGVKASVPDVTDAILKFVELGGLATEKGVELFKDFFVKSPDKFYAFTLPELWMAIKDRPDLQDYVADAYYSRVMPYAGPEEHFHWAVKALMNIISSAGAPPADVKFIVEKIVAENDKLLGEESQSSAWNLLMAIRESGEYRRPNNHGTPTVADKGKVLPMKGSPVSRQKNFPPIDGHNKPRVSKATKHATPPTASRASQHEDLATQLKTAVSK